MVEVKFGDFNHRPCGDREDQDKRGPSELAAKHDQGDLLHSVAEAVLLLNLEAGVEGPIGAARHERVKQRTTCATGIATALSIPVWGKVPMLRQARYSPGFLEARKTSDQVLVTAIQEVWIRGVASRQMDVSQHDVLVYKTFQPAPHQAVHHGCN